MGGSSKDQDPTPPKNKRIKIKIEKTESSKRSRTGSSSRASSGGLSHHSTRDDKITRSATTTGSSKKSCFACLFPKWITCLFIPLTAFAYWIVSGGETVRLCKYVVTTTTTAIGTSTFTYFSSCYLTALFSESIECTVSTKTETIEEKRYEEWYRKYHASPLSSLNDPYAKTPPVQKEETTTENIGHEPLPKALRRAMLDDLPYKRKKNRTKQKKSTTMVAEEKTTLSPTPSTDEMDSPTPMDSSNLNMSADRQKSPSSKIDSSIPEVSQQNRDESSTWSLTVIWNEIKSTMLWMVILTNSSLLSYHMGKRNRKPTKTNRTINLQESRNRFEMNPIRGRNTRHQDDDGFNNVNLQTYESVNSLPPPPQSTRM